jgi:hypothetical protein
MTAVSSAIEEVNEIRQQLVSSPPLTEPEGRRTLIELLGRSHELRREPIVEALIEDLRAFDERRLMHWTKAHLNEKRDNRIISAFAAPYYDALSFDGLLYRELPADEHLATVYGCNGVPVVVERMSDGFGPPNVVALFPENHIDGVARPEDRFFYFIDKFVVRQQRLTPRLIATATAPGSFPLVLAASEAEVQRSIVWWMHFHEHFHCAGDMPLPDYLEFKRAKPLAGIEELRVDVSGLLACLNDESLPREQAAMAYETILAERLLRYQTEGVPRPNYDAVGSQIFFNYLLDVGGIELRDDVVHLDPELPQALASFLGEITAIEARVHVEPPEQVARRTLAFANKYLDLDEQTNEYRPLPFFVRLKAKLGLASAREERR